MLRSSKEGIHPFLDLSSRQRPNHYQKGMEENGVLFGRRIKNTRIGILFIRRYRPLCDGAEILQGGGGELSLRFRIETLSRPSDVVFGGQLRIWQSGDQRSIERTDRHPSPARLPVSARGEGGSLGQAGAGVRARVRPEREDPVQRRRIAGDRRLV